MRACLFGTYNRSHSSNRIYVAAARAAGYEVVEIHEPLWEKTRDKGAAYFAPLRLVGLGLRWLAAAARLARRWVRSGGAPVAIVGFNGQLDVALLRLLTPRYGPRVVYAPLVTTTETLVDDRGVYRRGSIAARLLGRLDRFGCRLADVVVADTHAHRQYMIDALGIDGSRIAVCHLGADNAVFVEAGEPPARADGKLEVLYFGQYLPLHGLDVVVDAVGRLSRRDDLRFTFIGTGEDRERIERLVRATRADVEFLDWVAYEKLGERIAQAAIVLGVFGASAKARMVIPNKVYEAAAVGRAIVTADTPAVREVFTDESDVLLCKAEGADLAAAIARVADDADLRRALAARARSLMSERFSDRALGRAWSALLGGRVGARAAGDARTPEPAAGVAILNFNDSESTLRCLGSLSTVTYDNLRVLVVDNCSRAAERRRLEEGMAGRFYASVEWLEHNVGYARANNLALAKLFEQGCEYALVLNDDTVVTPDAVRALVACARAHPGAGPIGPRVARDWPGAHAASVGERYWAALAWLPRSLVRYRRTRHRSYPVRGVMGCAMLLSRTLFDRLGGFDEDYFAYYEEVDLCLRARRAGMIARVEPAAEIAHNGHRGFAGGFSPTAAYLKARNLWLLGRRRVGALGMLVFVPGYFALVAASTIGYRLRGRRAVARALQAGVAAGIRRQIGPPPEWVFEATAATPARGPGRP